MRDVAIVDYGVGNLLSVRRAFEHCGAEARMISSAEEMQKAERLVLPGVGAFGDGMRGLRERGLIEPIRAFVASGRPFLGICLGMQMMMESSEEFGFHEGLKLIKGRVHSIRSISKVPPKRIPHIGWNELTPSQGADWKHSLLEDVTPGSAVYFVHSFTPVPDHSANWLAQTVYEGVRLSAVIRSGAAYGCQFHPEKSGPGGLAMLSNFLKLRSTEASCASSV